MNVQKILTDLKEFLEGHPHVETIYFLANGTYCLHAFPFEVKGFEGKLYSRIDPDAAKAKNPGLMQAKYEIVKTFTREEIFDIPDQYEEELEEEKSPEAKPDEKKSAAPVAGADEAKTGSVPGTATPATGAPAHEAGADGATT